VPGAGVEIGAHCPSSNPFGRIDPHFVGVAVIDSNVVAMNVPARPKTRWMLFLGEPFAGTFNLRPIFIRTRCDEAATSSHEIDGVVIGPAAQEREGSPCQSGPETKHSV